MQIDACRLQRNALREEIVRQKDELQKEYLRQNTAKMTFDRAAGEVRGYGSKATQRIRAEANELDFQIEEIREASRTEEKLLLAQSETEEKETGGADRAPTGRAGAGSVKKKTDRLAANEEYASDSWLDCASRSSSSEETINRLSAESGRLLMEKEAVRAGHRRDSRGYCGKAGADCRD